MISILAFRDVAMAIVKSNQWMSALRNVTYFDQSTNMNNGAGGGGGMGGLTFTTPMRRIIRKMPGKKRGGEREA